MLTKPILTGSSGGREHSLRAVRRMAVVALALALGAGAAGDLLAAPACTRTPYALDTVRAMSAAPSPDGHLLVLDLRDRQVVKVDLPDGSSGPLAGVAAETLGSQRLEAIYGFDGGLLVRRAGTRDLVELDGRLGIKPGPSYRVTGTPGDDGSSVESVFILAAAGRDVVACSDLYLGGADRKRKENWRTVVVRIPLDAPAGFAVLHEFDPDDRSALGCRLALPLVATVGDRSFFLALEDVPRIYELRPGAEARPLTAFPERFAFSPTLATTDPDRKEIPEIYGVLERAAMPVGLFGWEGSLYLLTRSPAADRGTDWWLTRIDPATGPGAADTLAGTARLATGAHHLMVVPGDPYWALIEKGPVEAYDDQSITGIVAVPADEIRAWRPDGVICGPAAP